MLLMTMVAKSPNTFANKLGVAATQVYNIRDGRNAPSHGMYVLIGSKYPQVNLDWLITGRGAALKQQDEFYDDEHALREQWKRFKAFSDAMKPYENYLKKKVASNGKKK